MHYIYKYDEMYKKTNVIDFRGTCPMTKTDRQRD